MAISGFDTTIVVMYLTIARKDILYFIYLQLYPHFSFWQDGITGISGISWAALRAKNYCPTG